MNGTRMAGLLLSAMLVGRLAPISAQAPCTAWSVPIPVTKAKVALTEAQESDLGDAIAEHLERTYGVVHDDANGYLQQIGDRIVAELPPGGLRFRFMLVNIPSVNAFATPGGRIYVTRKLVAFAENEDELAGVLGHEIGHIITRQLAADMTEAFRQRLRVTAFGDRQDIFEKYHRLIDAPAAAGDNRGGGENDQYEADRVALLAVARAGYSPDAYVALWDRFTETNHNTGSFLSDFFAATRPESKRLREMLHSMEIVPKGCRVVAPSSTEAFKSWQKRVIETTGGSESTSDGRAVVHEASLDPPLHSDVTALRFSPDGRFLLAQDESSVYVLSRQPFSVLFRIDAEEAWPAQFTPDSTRVVFSTTGLRVERWNIASRSREAVSELVAPRGAIESQLSSDGRWLAYVDLAPAVGVFGIHLLDVEHRSEVFRKEVSSVTGLYRVRGYEHELEGGAPEVFELAFSPDGRYLLVGDNPQEVAVDLASHAEAKLPDSIRGALHQPFAFLGADRLVTVDRKRPEQSGILEFPSGGLLKSVALGGHVAAVTHGEALLLRPIKDWPVGLFDLTTSRVTIASKTPALDAYDDVRLSELPNGDIALFRAGSHEPEATVTLPVSPLGPLRAGSVSPDLRHIAISGRDRAGVWDSSSGHRLAHIRGFSSADIEDPSALYADFPSRKEVRDGKPVALDRTIARVNLVNGSSEDILTVGDAVAELHGRYYTTLTPQKPGAWDRDVTFEVRDIAGNVALWSRRFSNEPPWIYYDGADGRIVFEWDLTSSDAKSALKADAALRAAAEAPDLKDGGSLLEVLELRSGKALGRIVVSTGRASDRPYAAKKIRAVVSAGDVIVVLDRSNQAIVYSMSSGARIGVLFGRFAVVSGPAGLIALQNTPEVLQCYDSRTLERRADIHLGNRVRLARFSEDGSQLLLVTADQVAHVVDVHSLTSTPSSSQ